MQKTAKLSKSAVVRVPMVDAARSGPQQVPPEPADADPEPDARWLLHVAEILGSMEGAVLAGKLAAEVVAARAVGAPTQDLKAVQRHVVDAAATAAPKKPPGWAAATRRSRSGAARSSRPDAEQLRVAYDDDLPLRAQPSSQPLGAAPVFHFRGGATA